MQWLQLISTVVGAVVSALLAPHAGVDPVAATAVGGAACGAASIGIKKVVTRNRAH